MRNEKSPVERYRKPLWCSVSTGETELEMVKRHVRQGERHVMRQRQIIQNLLERNHPIALAEQLLMQFEQNLRDHRAHLARLVGKPA